MKTKITLFKVDETKKGSRINILDIVVLVFCFALTVYAQNTVYQDYYLVPIFIAGNMFLFCNIFRPGPLREFLWLVWIFVALFLVLRLDLQMPYDWYALVLSGTLATIISALRSPLYHGIGYRLLEKRRALLRLVE